jgi:hypothetical protein
MTYMTLYIAERGTARRRSLFVALRGSSSGNREGTGCRGHTAGRKCILVLQSVQLLIWQWIC